MKSVLTAALLAALAAAFPLRADEPPKDKPKDEKPTAEKQLEEITREYQKAQQPLIEEFKSAKTEEEKKAVAAKLPKVAVPFAAKAVKLAENNPKDPVAIHALGFALGAGRSERAAELLVETQSERPEFPRLLIEVADDTENPAVGKLLKLAAERGKGKQIQGLATLGLAQRDATLADSEEDLKKVEALGKEAETLAVKVAKDFADETGPQGKLGKAAEDLLFQIRNLSVGKKAPEVVSHDLDDKEVKLSSLKGKVVILDIWATWCGPCKAMIPHEREMVENLKDKPFTLISISADEKKETLKDFLEKEKMPWTHWWEGQNEKGILKEWGVHFFPTIYVIDAKGVIRYKHIRGKKLEEAVEKLVKEAEGKS
ncbi:MAG: TlpA family protein disulfide reductase [Gemmataceae bacterium]